MDEETKSRIRDYLEVLSEKEAAGILPAMKEVNLLARRRRLESELGEDLSERVRKGEFGWVLTESACDVLVLTANPIDLTQLDLETETKWIREECEAEDAKFPLAVRPRFGGVDEIGKWILKFRPKIVHFAGHGGPDGSLWLEKEDGTGSGVPAEAIANLMRLQKWRLDVVFLNACWTDRAAEPFLDLADAVIGMKSEIDDAEAVKFARKFYRGRVDGKSIRAAYEWGLAELALENRTGDVVNLRPGTGVYLEK